MKKKRLKAAMRETLRTIAHLSLAAGPGSKRADGVGLRDTQEEARLVLRKYGGYAWAQWWKPEAKDK